MTDSTAEAPELLRPYLATEQPKQNGWWDIHCPLHDDQNPSAGLNLEEWRWRCETGCHDQLPDNSLGELLWLLTLEAEESGPAVGFTLIEGPDREPEAPRRRRRGRSSPPQSLPSLDAVAGWHKRLMDFRGAQRWLLEERGLSERVLGDYLLGWVDTPTGGHYALPVWDEHAVLLNVRYLKRVRGGPSRKWGVTGHNVARLHPIASLTRPDSGPLVVCAGELDALCLLSKGINAITGTGGEKRWRDDWSGDFKDRQVAIAYDRDEAGVKGAEKVARSLRRAGVEDVRVVELPMPYTDKHGEDVTDYFVKYKHSPRDFLELIEATQPYGPVVPTVTVESNGGGRSVIDGASFILDQPPASVPLWGRGEQVVWPEGEGLMITGPQGVGKSTLAQQLTLERLGLRSGQLLEFPVAPDGRLVLYLAMDRPRQIARSFRRMVSEADRPGLRERLRVWLGPLPFNVLKEPRRLAEFAEEYGAGTVIVDSLKDVAPGLAADDVGSVVNSAFQEVIARGIDVAVLHHQRKAQQGASKPNNLDDVYGSSWLTAGMGSVVLLWAKPGGAAVELSHLKMPAAPVGPITIVHDHAAGLSRTSDTENEVLDLLAEAGDDGVTLVDVARTVFGSDREPEQQKARRRLKSLVGSRLATYDPGKSGGSGGGGKAPRWRLRMGGVDG